MPVGRLAPTHLHKTPSAPAPSATALQISKRAAGRDPITMTSAMMVGGHTLRVGYEFAGTGKSHTTSLRWDGTFRPGSPPSMNVKLDHSAGGDKTKGTTKGSVDIDLTPLLKEAQAKFGAQGKVKIEVNDLLVNRYIDWGVNSAENKPKPAGWNP